MALLAELHFRERIKWLQTRRIAWRFKTQLKKTQAVKDPSRMGEFGFWEVARIERFVLNVNIIA